MSRDTNKFLFQSDILIILGQWFTLVNAFFSFGGVVVNISILIFKHEWWIMNVTNLSVVGDMYFVPPCYICKIIYKRCMYFWEIDGTNISKPLKARTFETAIISFCNSLYKWIAKTEVKLLFKNLRFLSSLYQIPIVSHGKF